MRNARNYGLVLDSDSSTGGDICRAAGLYAKEKTHAADAAKVAVLPRRDPEGED